jgi:hypothetical protein
MTIHFQSTPADYREAIRGHARARLGRRWMFSIVPLLIALFYGLILFFSSRNKPSIAISGLPATRASQSINDDLSGLFLWGFLFVFLLTLLQFVSGKLRHRFTDVSRSGKRWLSPLKLIWIGGALFLGDFLFSTGMSDHNDPGQTKIDRMISVWGPIVTWALVVGFLYFFAFRKLQSRRWTMQPSLERPKTVEYSPEQLSIADELVTNTYRWTAFVRCVETENLFMLYPSELSFHMVPKRAFPSTDAADVFRRLIQEWADGQSLGFPVITPAPSNN